MAWILPTQGPVARQNLPDRVVGHQPESAMADGQLSGDQTRPAPNTIGAGLAEERVEGGWTRSQPYRQAEASKLRLDSRFG
jgi:hypothetical protein